MQLAIKNKRESNQITVELAFKRTPNDSIK